MLSWKPSKNSHDVKKSQSECYKTRPLLLNLSLKFATDIDSASSADHEASIREFVEDVRTYRVIFLDSKQQLLKFAQDFVTKHFEATRQQIKQFRSVELLAILRKPTILYQLLQL
ncbi:unnamed protein product [Fraxinus pennsylvanica]|uniref:Uncharacterized protein n=1 Tax=Fraxinus pennsylvanica TaxID=56036 RepID=A0AAD2E3U3_9LAMI|nr:unnamed protein product [Fraxinus pennsylvanica]